jgi:Flp pilus assembly pilin Flp
VIFCVIGSLDRFLASARWRVVPSELGHAIKAVCLDTNGNTLVEYAMVMSLLSVAMLSGMSAIGTAAASALSNVESELLNYGIRNNS